MVAVKSLWVLWKNFSTNFSFSNLSTTINNNHSHNDNVKYNRLRTFDKSISSYFPMKGSTSTTSFSTNCNNMKKSYSSYDPNSNPCCSTSIIGSSSNNNCKNPEHSLNSSSGVSSCSTSSANNIAWALNNSDTEFEDNDEDADDGCNEYRLAMAMTPADYFSDLDDEDEALTCDVCDRSFSTAKRLADHQFKKRHYGCLQCDSIFPSKEALEEHREQMDHYDFVSDYESDTTSFESDDEDGITDSDGDDEERERLL